MLPTTYWSEVEDEAVTRALLETILQVLPSTERAFRHKSRGHTISCLEHDHQDGELYIHHRTT